MNSKEAQELAKTFKESWENIKEMLNDQADELRTVSEVLTSLIDTQTKHEKEFHSHNEILRKLIDRQF